ncbi:MAG: cupin domain-containing protein [Streptosporangiales bacterium]|nr:cupin domain-containing protein [Streptosporangiales bacterium]
MPLIKLDEMEKEYVTPKYSTAFGELVTGNRIEVGRLAFEPGEGAVAHSHPQEQVMYVISGRLAVEFPDETGELGPGEAFHAPANVWHKVTALESTVVISCKDVVDGVGHKVAPGETDRLDELGKKQ